VKALSLPLFRQRERVVGVRVAREINPLKYFSNDVWRLFPQTHGCPLMKKRVREVSQYADEADFV
jgi:hypothetical protein